MQAVERNLALATQRADKAEKKLAEVQAELDRRKVRPQVECCVVLSVCMSVCVCARYQCAIA